MKRERKYFQPDANTRQVLAFTLIELLVVIAIIAILAALLLPTLSRAKSAAEASACKSNLHQVSIALHLYIGDFRAYPPGRGAVTPGRPLGTEWYGLMTPYLRTDWPEYNVMSSGVTLPHTSVFACPGYNRMPGVYGIRPGDYLTWGAYGYNGGGVTASPVVSDNSGVWRLGLSEVHEAEVLRPTDMIVFADSPLIPPEWNGFDGSLNIGTLNLPFALFDSALRPPGQMTSPASNHRRTVYQRRHSGRFNIIFCDGHAEYGKPEAFFDARHKPWVAQRWNNDNQPHLDLFGYSDY